MQIIPAIDIRNGKCVRLTQGDFAREKIYNDDPVIVAKQWQKEGASAIHLVDLDGAKDGNLKNFETIKKIIKNISIPVQVGGGIRNKKNVEKLLKIGVKKVILGTIALEDLEELKKIIEYFPDQIMIALDSKNGKLMKKGWVENSDQDTLSAAKKLEEIGVKFFIFTDITKDGTLTEPNFEGITKLIKNISGKIIVSGGISNLEQVKKIKEFGAEGVIIGKALYEKKVNLKEVIKNVN